jgi:hypothetical protein
VISINELGSARATAGEFRARAGIRGDELMLRGVEQLMQRHADGEDQREHFETVKGPGWARER